MIDIKKLPEETEEQFLWKIGQMVDSGKIANWAVINDIVNRELNIEEDRWRDESSFRKRYQAAKQFYEGCFSKMQPQDYQDQLMLQKRELEKSKIQFRDERNAWQRQNYIAARTENKLNLLEEKLSELGRIEFSSHEEVQISGTTDLLVILSDLHIGHCFSSALGEYNSTIAQERLNQLLLEVIRIGRRHNSENVFVSIQGDLISGSIHKTLAVTNRENVIEQIKLAAELITSFCYELSKYFSKVLISNVCGNHSRIDRKEEALHDERLDDLVSWIVETSLKHIDNVKVLHRNIDSGISNITIKGRTYI